MLVNVKTAFHTKLTFKKRSLQCCTNSCSLPANKLRPTGSKRFKHATIKDAWISFALSRFLSRCFFFFCKLKTTDQFFKYKKSLIIITFPPEGCDPSGTTVRLVAVGIIRTILSISLAEIKFCSSLKKYWELDQILNMSATWLYRSSASGILWRNQWLRWRSTYFIKRG